MTYTIRPFEKTNTDYMIWNDIYNAMYPDYAELVEVTKHRDATLDPSYFMHRDIIEKDGQAIAVGSTYQSQWSFHPQKYAWRVFVHPDHDLYTITRLHYDHVLNNILTDKDIIALKSHAREDQAICLRFLEEEGFQFKMRYPHSELAVDSFDASKFATKLAQTRDAGIEVFNLVELEKREPDNWQSIVHVLCSRIEKEVPNPDGLESQTLDEFIKTEFESPKYLHEGWFVAHDGTDYVGITMLFKNDMIPDKLQTGLTGTLQQARRKGVATALKVNAIEFAKAYGAKRIETDNEENNPMYQINLKLGFTAIPAWSDYEKPLS